VDFGLVLRRPIESTPLSLKSEIVAIAARNLILAPNRADGLSDVSMACFGPSPTMRPSRSNTTRSISGMISETWCVTGECPGHLVQATASYRRSCSRAPMSSALLGSSNSSVCGSCTSARAISVRLASPEDICASGRAARCAMPKRASAASVFSSRSGLGAWCGKIRVLLKKPDSTTSRPVASVVQMLADRRDDAQQRAQLKNVPALAAENRDGGVLARNRVAFPRGRLDQRGLAATIRTQDANMLTGVDSQGESCSAGWSSRSTVT